MKARIIVMLLGLMTVSLGCNNDDDTNSQALDLVGEWHVIRITGGVGGVDEIVERGIIIWTFTENERTVINTYMGSPGDPITLPYTVIEVQGRTYLKVDGQESGEITLVNNQLGVDTNKNSSGNDGNDGFGYTLER